MQQEILFFNLVYMQSKIYRVHGEFDRFLFGTLIRSE
jgi:hypothetical protein